MSEQLILLEDIENLGRAGDTVNVAPGYARNYLLPKKLALKASKGALRQLNSRMEKIQAKRQEDLDSALKLAEQLGEHELTIPMQAGEDDQLYGSVTSHSITDELEKAGFSIDHHKVVMDGPFKQLGAFDFKVKLHPEVTAECRLWIVRA